MDANDPSGPPPSGKRLAVLETEAHAEEVVARAHGADVLEAPLAPGPRAPAAGLAPRAGGGSGSWERERPLEAPPLPPPQVPFARGWDGARGRLSALRGAGRQVLNVLRGRRPP